MVADINATGAASSPLVVNDSKTNNNTNDTAFADALAQGVAQDKSASNATSNTATNNESSAPNTTNNASSTTPNAANTATSTAQNTQNQNAQNTAQNNQNATTDSKDSKNNTKDSQTPQDSKQDSKNLQPNALNTKVASKDSKSALSKALNKEEINATTTPQDENAEITTDSQNAENEANIESENAQDSKLDSKDIKNIGARNGDTKGANNIDATKSNTEPKKLTNKELQAIKEQELAEKLKTLSDVKKEAQARNLNLQKIDIVEQGRKIPVNPQDLMDSEMLDSINKNRNRLANSLQQQGQAVATSIANATNKELSEKDKLLAELLNRYDAAENARRKAANDKEKLQFKVENGDKSTIINRNAMQPGNIVNPAIRNEAMQQDFLEKLHEITGDEALEETLASNQARLEVMLEYAKKAAALKEVPKANATPNLQGWAKQGEFVAENSELELPKDVSFEIDGNKPFDNMLQEKMKADSTKEAVATKKSDEKVAEKSTDSKIDSKQELSAAQAKQELSVKNAQAREMIRNFAGQFKEEVMNYKPPITKINLELNPASLGEVSMSISKKGKDLQVSITTNANVMTMFVQNAQELRQNLMQIGFNNLDLNFSARDNNQKGDSNQNSGDNNAEDSKLQSIDEAQSALSANADSIPSALEITLPEYA